MMKYLYKKYTTIRDTERLFNGAFIREKHERPSPFRNEVITGRLYYGPNKGESAEVSITYRGNTGWINFQFSEMSSEQCIKSAKMKDMLKQAEEDNINGYHDTLTQRAVLLRLEALLYTMILMVAATNVITTHINNAHWMTTIASTITIALTGYLVNKVTEITLNKT